MDDNGDEDSARIHRVRAKVAARFAKVLENDDLGTRLEIVLWNHTLRGCQRDRIPLEWSREDLSSSSFRERYTTRAIGLDLHNLRTFEPLRKRIQSGELPLKEFIEMTPYQMAPEKWDPIFERVAFQQLKRQLTIDVENAPEGMLQCRKCKSKKTVFMEMQTRSADEPMTVFATCLECQNRWKQ
jgi:DNA-directed RNA polymerase subunit M/transcription elongation factor TFIIS